MNESTSSQLRIVDYDQYQDVSIIRFILKIKESLQSTTYSYSLNFNGLSDLENRTLTDSFRACIKSIGLHKREWNEAFMHTAYFRKRLSSPVLRMRALDEHLLGKSPDNTKTGTFGCACYVHIDEFRKALTLEDYAQLDVYFETRSGLYRCCLWKKNRMLETKHESVDVI